MSDRGGRPGTGADVAAGSRVRVRRDGAVATAVIDRPPVNAVDPALIDELLGVLARLDADPEVRCIVLTGAGRVFVAGADLTVMRDPSERTQRAMRRWVEVQRVVERAAKPVIAGLNGHALGGGAELALACDLRVIADTAQFGFPEITLGFFPGGGGSQRLPRLVGAHLARRLMIDGERLSAACAAELGLVDVVVDTRGGEDFAEVLAARAQAWAAKPTRAIAALKRVVDEGRSLTIDEALAREDDTVLAMARTADAAEGVAAFLEKRAPHFTGR